MDFITFHLRPLIFLCVLGIFEVFPEQKHFIFGAGIDHSTRGELRGLLNFFKPVLDGSVMHCPETHQHLHGLLFIKGGGLRQMNSLLKYSRECSTIFKNMRLLINFIQGTAFRTFVFFWMGLEFQVDPDLWKCDKCVCVLWTHGKATTLVVKAKV
eukprot:1161963-Pelagomonas_calceolata.AAC.16